METGIAPGSSSLPVHLQFALDIALDALCSWAADPSAFRDVLRDVFRVQHTAKAAAQLQQQLLHRTFITPEISLLDPQAIGTAFAAYSSPDHNQPAQIFLNSSWLRSATNQQLQAVLLEELGHAIDHSLNGNDDSPGDEGERFSSLSRGLTPPPAALSSTAAVQPKEAAPASPAPVMSEVMASLI